MAIPIPAYAPDRSNDDPGTTNVATNVVPQAESYGPIPALQNYGPDAITGTPNNGIVAWHSDGTHSVFVGTENKIWKYSSGSTSWSDVSRVGSAYTTVDTGWFWDFYQFGNYVIATNGEDDVQVFELGVSSTFTALGGNPPKARRVTAIGESLVLYNLHSDDGQTNELYWSSRNDITGWTVSLKGCDRQVLPVGGEILFIAPQSSPGSAAGNAFVIMERSNFLKMSWVGGSILYRFDVLEHARTCSSPRSCVHYGNRVFWAADDGFMMFDGSSFAEIGEELVDRTHYADMDIRGTDEVFGVVDPATRRVWFWYKSDINNDYYDKAVIYAFLLQRWSTVEDNILCPISLVSQGVSLDNIATVLGYTNLDTMPFSPDAPFLAGGTPVLGAIDENGLIGFFEGSNMEATVEIELSPNEEARTTINSFMPTADASDIRGRVGTRQTPGGSVTWRDEVTMRPSGHVPVYAVGYYLRLRIRIPAGESWSHIRGIRKMRLAGGSDI